MPKDLTRVRRPKFITLEPGDMGEFLLDAFVEGEKLYLYTLHRLRETSPDPRTCKPEPGPLEQIHAWGLYPVKIIFKLF